MSLIFQLFIKSNPNDLSQKINEDDKNFNSMELLEDITTSSSTSTSSTETSMSSSASSSFSSTILISSPISSSSFYEPVIELKDEYFHLSIYPLSIILISLGVSFLIGIVIYCIFQNPNDDLQPLLN